MTGKRSRTLPAWMKEDDSPDAASTKVVTSQVKNCSNTAESRSMDESSSDQRTKITLNKCDESVKGLHVNGKHSETEAVTNSVKHGHQKISTLSTDNNEGKYSLFSSTNSKLSENDIANDSAESLQHQQIHTISDDEEEEENQGQDIQSVSSSKISNVDKEQSSLTTTNTLNSDISTDDAEIGSSHVTASNNDNTPSGDDAEVSHSSRPACFYGSSCYRKNPQHRKEYSHPGDADYSQSSDSSNSVRPSDNRPLCKYGASCYRKNPQHRLDFSHDVTKKRKARPTGFQDITSDEEDLGGEITDEYNPGDSETDDSFVTSDSVESGGSDFNPDDEDDGEDADKKKRKQKKKDSTRTKKKMKKKEH